MMTTCHCIETLTHWLKSLPYHHVYQPTYFPQIANQWKNKTLQSKQFQSLVSPIGLVTPIKIVHHWKLCIILFLEKNEHFVEFQFYLTPLWADFQSCWIMSLHWSGLRAMPIGHAFFRISFCFLSFNSSIARPFDSSGVGGFPSISSLFASFPSRPTHSRCLCLGLQEQTSKLTQSNATHILSRFSETHHHLHPHPSLVNTAPFPSCQWTLASLFFHWEFSHRFQKGCRRKMEESLW